MRMSCFAHVNRLKGCFHVSGKYFARGQVHMLAFKKLFGIHFPKGSGPSVRLTLATPGTYPKQQSSCHPNAVITKLADRVPRGTAAHAFLSRCVRCSTTRRHGRPT